MFRRLTTLGAAGTLAATLSIAAAPAASADYYDRARVVGVEPIIVREPVVTEREQCRLELVRSDGYHGHARHDHEARGSTGATLFGSLLGGVIGHQFGGGNGKKALTVAGALVGGAIANSASRSAREAAYERGYRDAGWESTHKRRRVCRVFEETEWVDRVDGYEVTYRYKGHEFVKTTTEHPGKYVRVRVRVEPDTELYALRG